jgi:tetratricopeptide (TPR) repeat protein
MQAPRRAAGLTRLAAAAIFLSGAGCGGWSPADAQRQIGTVMELGGSRLAVSAQEMRALSNLGNLARSGQVGAQDRALAEARRIANGRDARYALALYELEIGRRRGDDGMRAKALDALITSPLTARDKLPGHLASRGQIAYRAGDLDTAGRLWGRVVELTPSDADALANLAQVRSAQGHYTGALDLLTRAIAAREGLGQAGSEVWHRQRLSIAQQGNMAAPGVAAARALVEAYPTPGNWRVALVVYRQLAASDGAFEVDVLRLMRHVGALAQAAEYQRMAQLLKQAGEPGEAKAVLQEGMKRGLLDPGTSPTREIVAEVDRAAAKMRGGPSGGVGARSKAGAQVRLGVARLLGGQRGEAEAAFRAAAGDAAGGRYADLAFFWLTSLAQGEAVVAAAT